MLNTTVMGPVSGKCQLSNREMKENREGKEQIRLNRWETRSWHLKKTCKGIGINNFLNVLKQSISGKFLFPSSLENRKRKIPLK